MEYFNLDTALIQEITSKQAWHYHIVPKLSENGHLNFYISDKQINSTISDELELILSKKVELFPAPHDKIYNTLSKYYRREKNQEQSEKLTTEGEDDFVFTLIKDATLYNSSDIHIESYEEKSRIRFRVDGKLSERYIIEQEEYPVLINKLKILANLDIAEKRLPQDGRIFYKIGDDQIDIRVSILPTLFGEKAVLRLLNKDASNIDIQSLGLTNPQISTYKEAIARPNGIILISGPTGSGKTTTLYATLKLLNKQSSNILTIEDPIEYTLPGINQVQLKDSIGLTFAAALRTFLRQDPDIIMLGEIRDNETAQMAIRAALTGHLVLSTIHTNSALGTISRLMDMGVPPYLLSSTLNISVAQRLVRLLCPKCKKKEVFNTDLLPRGIEPNEEINSHYVATGCNSCFHSGYKGRKALYELVPIHRELSESIRNNNFNSNYWLKNRNITTLADSAMNIFKNGETSIEEIYPILMNNL